MLAKKFFINTGINITVKTDNRFYSSRRYHLPHNYVPLSNFIIFLTNWGDKGSSFLHLPNLLPSDSNNLNLDSSLKWSIFHHSSFHRICSVTKSIWTIWFFFEIKGLQYGIQATNFSLFNPQETVFLNIGFCVCSLNAREIDIALYKRSFKDILIITRSSRLVVIGGLPVLSFGSSVLSTDYTINNTFCFSYDANDFRIRFIFFMIC